MKRLVVLALILSCTGLWTMAQDGGTITQVEFNSATLGRLHQYNIYLPAGYDASIQKRYPVIYLLHGRGDTMSGWTNAKPSLDRMIADGTIPPVIAVMPDFPSSDRAGYYVDSKYNGAEAVETAFFQDLIPHIDNTFRTLATRESRLVGGYSMGGYGAIRYSLAHPDMFSGALVLSPAVYIPLPPVDSSTREFGAFGNGESLFDEDIYTSLNYPALLPMFRRSALGLSMFIAVGDDEWKNERPEDVLHDLDVEAHMLFNHVARVPNIRSEFRVYDGGHDWDVWRRGFEEGMAFLAGSLSTGEPTTQAEPLEGEQLGSDGPDFAGGIATDDDGSTVLAMAANGSIDGQPYSGELDAVVIKTGANGARQWTRQFGTPGNDRIYGVAVDSRGDVVVAGYTRGDLDGKHAGADTDDAFVAKLSADGELTWVTQFGVPDAADRLYALTVAPDGMIYAGGYSSGSLGGESAGDKDVIVGQISPDGEIGWLQQFGDTGEDKAYSVALSDDALYVVGVIGTDIGGLDAYVSAFSLDGEQQWLEPFGTEEWDEAQSVVVLPDGTVVVTGFASGELDGLPFAGDRDIFVTSFNPDGTALWSNLFGTLGNDKGAVVAVNDTGGIIVAAHSDGDFAGSAGAMDIVLLGVDATGTVTWMRQLGTDGDDGADEYAEKNLFMTLTGESLLLTGLTTGAVGDAALGSGDVFFTRLNLD